MREFKSYSGIRNLRITKKSSGNGEKDSNLSHHKIEPSETQCSVSKRPAAFTIVKDPVALVQS
jgi:hypothetical protein